MDPLWLDPRVREAYDVSFSFRSSAGYSQSVQELVPTWVRKIPLDIAPTHRQGLSRYHRFARDVRILTRVFDEVRPDVVHISNGGFPGSRSARAAAVAARRVGCSRVVMVVNNQAIGYRSPGRVADYPHDRRAVAATDVFVTGSAAARLRLISVTRKSGDHVLQVANAVRDPGHAVARPHDSDRLVLAMVAVAERRKGHHVLLDALDVLARTEPSLLPSLEIVIVGDGPEMPAIVGRTSSVIAANVRLLGTRADYLDVMRRADVVLQPSTGNEDFPLATLEAMALGRPVVASRLAGLEEQVVDGETGLLVEPGDARRLADAIALVAFSPELRDRMGAAARRRYVEMFTPERYIDQILRIYDGVTP